MKLLWWLILATVCYLLLRPKAPSSAPPADSAQKKGFGEKMVQCAHCDMFVPSSEALLGAGGRAYCCDEHRLRHRTE